MKRLTILLTGVLLAAPVISMAAIHQPSAATERLEREVRRELVTLPFFNVFDHLAFQVRGEEVVLSGQVTRPTLKRDAENVVKRIEGVTKVTNEIRVLPLSGFDDRVRLGVLRAVYGQSALNRYALGAQPAIRIIVENGNVTLEGVVARESEKNIAGMMASSVFGVFSVTNNLRVEGA